MRGRLLAGSVLAVMTVLTCGAVEAPPRRVRLLDVARVVIRHKWDFQDWTEFQWVSEQDLLIFPAQLKHDVVQRNVLTGREVPLSDLTWRLRKIKGKNLLPTPANAAQWVMVENAGRAPDFTDSLHAYTLDGKQHADWKEPQNCEHPYVFWMSDNRHWLGLCTGPATGKYVRALLGDVQVPGKLLEIPLPDDSPFNQINHSINCAVSPERILAVPGRFYRTNGYQGRTVPIYELSIKDNIVSATQHVVTLPEGTGLQEVKFSPNGRQIALLLRSLHKLPYEGLKPVRLLPALKSEATWEGKPDNIRAINSIWISDGDGRNMREVGYIDVALRESDLNPAIRGPFVLDGGSDEPSSMEWLPGGNYLSLWIENEMYRFSIH